jgi:hypothetical protein
MKISEIVLEKTANNHGLDAYLKAVVSMVSEHISSNAITFFPEYTDHDISHLEAVLETAVDLATEKSLELMSDVDLAALTTSVLLHDLGMHLTKDGFQTLISSDGPLKPIDGFGDPVWSELWVSFLAEARRFDARKLEALFGSNFKPVTSFPSFDDPWDEFDILLVGEFLRRHHPRLGHEIALQGMPSVDGSVVQFCGMNTAEERFWSDISGLIARSHGMRLRQTFIYLEHNYYSKIETRSAHPVLLMVLLRIADYLQIQNSRAPTARTQVTKFKSPISTREWSVHQCVSDITNVTDPEAIDITARPLDVETFLRLKYWLDDLQRELDLSWAVLGEVYGLQSHSGLSKLGMRIRRIKSNLDDVDEFARTVSYIPETIAFETAGSDLLKLLVGPLYANDVSVGLRELVQNATDAVKELDQLISDGSIERPENGPDINGDVQVDFFSAEGEAKRLRPKIKEIVITDRGVGMSPAIVKDYFLKAGASLRSSDAWKEHFTNADGTEKVQRSGRFGVGALAAFLLGDKITVETRHYSEPESNGLIFSAGIDTTSINVMRHRCNVGTTIRIEIPERLQNKVGNLIPYRDSAIGNHTELGGYFGKYPSLNYTIDGNDIPWDETNLLPSARDPYQDPWNYFETNNFEVNWCFDKNVYNLFVNQIRVLRIGNYYRDDRSSIDLECSFLKTPSISLGDNTGSFPLNLQRDSLSSKKIPFARELVTDIADEFIFTCAYHRAFKKREDFPKYIGLTSSIYYNYQYHYWLHCSDGKILNHPLFLQEYDPSFALLRYGGGRDLIGINAIMSGLPEKSIAAHEPNDEFTGRKFKMKGKLTRLLQGEAPQFIDQATTRTSVYVPEAFANLIIESMQPGKEATKQLNTLRKDEIDGWMVQQSEMLNEPERALRWRKSFDKDGISSSVICYHELTNSWAKPNMENDSAVFDRWMELVGTPFIPNSKTEIDKLLRRLKEQLGSKYDTFERRANDARRKQAAKKAVNQ